MVSKINSSSTCLLDYECPIAKKNKEKIELARERILLRDGGFSYLPGLTNIVIAPLSIYGDLKSAYTAVKIGDREGTAHTGTRLFQNFLAFWGAAASVLEYEDAIFHNLPVILPKEVAYGSGILGAILCFVEFVIESLALIRTSRFRGSSLMSFAKFLETNQELAKKNPQKFARELQKEVEHVQKYLTEDEKEIIENLSQKITGTSLKPLIEMCTQELNQFSMVVLTRAFAAKYFDKHDETKQIKLERRIGVATAVDIEQKLTKLTKRLSESVPMDEAVEKSLKLFSYIDDQAAKKQVVHILGICAAVLVGIAIALTFCSGYGTAVIVGLFVLGTLLSLARYAYLYGVCSHEGWHFDFKACLPELLQKRIDRQREAYLADA